MKVTLFPNREASPTRGRTGSALVQVRIRLNSSATHSEFRIKEEVLQKMLHLEFPEGVEDKEDIKFGLSAMFSMRDYSQDTLDPYEWAAADRFRVALDPRLPLNDFAFVVRGLPGSSLERIWVRLRPSPNPDDRARSVDVRPVTRLASVRSPKAAKIGRPRPSDPSAPRESILEA